jgi:hypothetical protein
MRPARFVSVLAFVAATLVGSVAAEAGTAPPSTLPPTTTAPEPAPTTTRPLPPPTRVETRSVGCIGEGFVPAPDGSLACVPAPVVVEPRLTG